MLIFPYRLRPASRRAQSDLLHDRHNEGPPPEPSGDPQQDAQAALQPQHRLRGVIGYHNPFRDPLDPDLQDDLLPPAYGSKCATARLRPSESLGFEDTAVIPQYDCSVFMQNMVDVKVEKESPFDCTEEPRWYPRFAVLTGTQLCLHEIKRHNPISMAANPLLTREVPGKLVQKYTLQHAEVGLAADHRKFIMVPKSALVNLLSASAIEHLQATEPHKFEKIYQYVIRLRVEAAQILLKFSSSQHRNDWVERLSAAIDISQPLESRTEPKVVTLPRRRRRRAAPGNLDSMRDDQMRIAREQFPQLIAGSGPGAIAAAEEDGEPDTVHDVDDGRQAEPGAQEVEDAEHAATQGTTASDSRRGSTTRRNGSLAAPNAPLEPAQQTLLVARGLEVGQPTVTGVDAMAVIEEGIATLAGQEGQDANAEPPSDFDPETGKWTPYIAHDHVQESRIRRRCMPSLLFNSKRASDIICFEGKRVRIDWEARSLRPWPELPPAYGNIVEASSDGDYQTRSDVRRAMNSPPRTVGQWSAREHSQSRAEPVAATRSGRARTRHGRRFTTEGSDLRIEIDAPNPSPVLRVTADDATSGTSEGSISPTGNRNLLTRLPRLLRRMTSKQGSALKMTHNNKSFAGQTCKERAILHQDLHHDLQQDDSEGIDRLHSHASSVVGREDAVTAAPISKVYSAVEQRATTAGLSLIEHTTV